MCVCLIFDSRSGKIKTKITGSKWFERKEDIKQMRLPQIINSLLETDMYKFSMGQTISISSQAIKRHGPSSAEIKTCILQRDGRGDKGTGAGLLSASFYGGRA